jgi:hypothetical protein
LTTLVTGIFRDTQVLRTMSVMRLIVESATWRGLRSLRSSCTRFASITPRAVGTGSAASVSRSPRSGRRSGFLLAVEGRSSTMSGMFSSSIP